MPHAMQLVWFAITSKKVETFSKQLPWRSALLVMCSCCGGTEETVVKKMVNALQLVLLQCTSYTVL